MIALDDDTEHTAFEVGEFDTCLAMKDSRSAAGYDGMKYGIFKGCNEDMKTLFLKVINHYWLYGSCPADCKLLNIIPAAKPGKDIYVISSYRPISLIPVLAKLTDSL
jgi:hypothetical protein